MFRDSPMLQDANNIFARTLWHKRVGNSDRDTEQLREVSPVYHAARVQTPVMSIYGENDPRIPLSQSLDMVHTLREHGNLVEYHGRADEGNGFNNYNNIFEMFLRIDDFMQEHMPPD